MIVFYSWLYDTYDYAPEDFHCMGSSEQLSYLVDFVLWLKSVVVGS